MASETQRAFVRLAWAATVVAISAETVHPMSKVVQLRSETWQRVERGNWLVKFYAPWCTHCKRMAPAYERLAVRYNDAEGGTSSATVAQVDGTTQAALLKRYDIEGYPSIIFFSEGKRVATYQGSRTFEGFVQFVETHSARSNRVDAKGTGESIHDGGAKLSSWQSVGGGGGNGGRLLASLLRLISVQLDFRTVVVGVLAGAMSCSMGLLALLFLSNSRRREGEEPGGRR
jgi:protein disulfide-isomerase-like protein